MKPAVPKRTLFPNPRSFHNPPAFSHIPDNVAEKAAK
jgi:hypothetical protein